MNNYKVNTNRFFSYEKQNKNSSFTGRIRFATGLDNFLCSLCLYKKLSSIHRNSTSIKDVFEREEIQYIP